MGIKLHWKAIRFWIVLFIIFFSFNLSAQNKNDKRLYLTFDSEEKWLKRVNYKNKIRDSLELEDELRSVLNSLYKKSYLAASIDSISSDSLMYWAYIHLGEQLNWARLRKGNLEEEVLSKTGYRDKIFNNYRFRYKQFGRFMENIVTYYEDDGYPFVSLQLDSITHQGDQGIEATLHLKKNKYIAFDTVEIFGDYIVHEKYLYNYLNIKPGKPYNESNVQAISKRIEDLLFLGENRPANVVFTETRTSVQIFPRKQKASRFDGFVGLLQDEETGEVTFTGEVTLELMNTFKRGELIALKWRGLPENTQDLNVKFLYPYLLNTPFGIDLQFQLYRRDTTFLDVISTVGIPYYINARDYLEVIYQNHQSNLLSTSQYENSNTIPEVLDFQTNLYGVKINLNKLDYLLNPTKGFKVVIDAKAGFKNIQKNPSLNDSIYDEIELSNVIFRGEGSVQYFLPITRRHVLLFANQSAYVDNEQILTNELYRIGGLKKLRGFDEETIFVSLYAINTFEYRFMLEKNSNLNLFLDYAYIEREVIGQDKFVDRPFGFGIGSTFQTAAGIFTISYAIGTQQGNPIDFQGAKIHFGFLNYF